MPHVVIEAEADLCAFAARFLPILIRDGGDVLRADQVFAEVAGRAVLIEALAVEAGRRSPFYVKVARHDRGTITVRVDPLTHADRSEGVKRLVVEVAEQLLRETPGARVLRTNLVIPSVG